MHLMEVVTTTRPQAHFFCAHFFSCSNSPTVVDQCACMLNLWCRDPGCTFLSTLNGSRLIAFLPRRYVYFLTLLPKWVLPEVVLVVQCFTTHASCSGTASGYGAVEVQQNQKESVEQTIFPSCAAEPLRNATTPTVVHCLCFVFFLFIRLCYYCRPGQRQTLVEFCSPRVSSEWFHLNHFSRHVATATNSITLITMSWVWLPTCLTHLEDWVWRKHRASR